jgi:hypothetical protein
MGLFVFEGVRKIPDRSITGRKRTRRTSKIRTFFFGVHGVQSTTMFPDTKIRILRSVFPVATILLLGACSQGAAGPASSPTVDAYRATPEADTPAAGICASIEAETIRIEIRAWPDGVPDPRCVAVRAEQKLILLNSAAETIAFTLGRYHGTINPGGSFAIDLPFGQYLAPGAHSLHVTPYGGPEIFFP